MKNLIYLKLYAIYNNILLNCCILGNKVFSNYFNDKIIYYKKQKEIYNNYIFFISFSDEIYKKYNINLLSISSKLFNLTNSIAMNKINEDDDMSSISSMSSIMNNDDDYDEDYDDDYDEYDNISIMSDLD